MNSDFHIIIPARYHSSRLPGKLLMEIGGKSVLQRVYEQSVHTKPKSVVIACDHNDIATHAKAIGAKVVMTQSHHQSGTDRIAEVISLLNFKPEDIIVNVQGDEPFIAPELIRQVSSLPQGIDMATLCWPLDNVEQLHNPNVVKVVRDGQDNALYFSRSPIPAHRDYPNTISGVFRHIGLYAYRAGFLQEFVKWPQAIIEQYESLEQLRVLWMGHKIRVTEACVKPMQDINTKDDLEAARCLFG